MSVPSKLELSLSPALVVSVISPPVGVAEVIHSVLPGTQISNHVCILFSVCLEYYETYMLNVWSSTHLTRPILKTYRTWEKNMRKKENFILSLT